MVFRFPGTPSKNPITDFGFIFCETNKLVTFRKLFIKNRDSFHDLEEFQIKLFLFIFSFIEYLADACHENY